MSTLDHQLAVSARFLRRAFALACVASLLLVSSTNAGTVLQFAQIDPTDIVTATDVAGTTTLTTLGNANGAGVSIPVEITNFLGTPVLIPAFETYVGVTSVGAAGTDILGNIGQKFSGTIEITSLPGGAGLDYLTAVFTTMTLSPVLGGATGGTQAQLTAAEPPDSLLLTTDPFFATTFGYPTGMTIGFSNVTPALSIAGDGSIAGFTGQNAGTFSAPIVPEPGTLCLASFAVVFGLLAYGKKRMKDKG